MRNYFVLLFALSLTFFSSESSSQASPLKEFCEQLNLKPCPRNLLIKSEISTTYATPSPDRVYVEFSEKINFFAMADLLDRVIFDAQKKRSAIQKLAQNLNQQSVNNYIINIENSDKTPPTQIEYVAVNNSAVFHFSNDKGSNIKPRKNTTALKKTTSHRTIENTQSNIPVIGLLDSGVSLKNDSMRTLNISQFYPAVPQQKLVDTGLGHGTGIVSLTEQLSKKEGVGIGSYLSCVGLPHGKYQFIDTLHCLDWFFLQPKVDIILNPWLASDAGCLSQWNYPFQMIWLAGSIPIFSAGNYGENIEQNYSPANLSPFYPLVDTISVGAVDHQNKRLPSSSFQQVNCKNRRSIATLSALGSGYKVAVPFTESSEQNVEGTSYSIVPVAIALLSLRRNHPKLSNRELVSKLFQDKQ